MYFLSSLKAQEKERENARALVLLFGMRMETEPPPPAGMMISASFFAPENDMKQLARSSSAHQVHLRYLKPELARVT